MQASLRYLFRGREFAWDFYGLQPVKRLAVSVDGRRQRVPGGYRYTMTLSPSDDIVMKDIAVEIPLDLDPDDRVFVNGYQSWTESREFGQAERVPRLKWPARTLLKQYGDYWFHRSSGRRGRFHGWTYSYVRSGPGLITLYGSVSERPGYTLFEYDCPHRTLTIHRDCDGLHLEGEYRALDFVVLSGSDHEVFDAYFDFIRNEGRPGSLDFRDRADTATTPSSRNAVHETRTLTGWTSWYRYYTKVTQELVLRDLSAFRRLGLDIDVFQIDDGWEPKVGDWLTANERFPMGMAQLASAIKGAGMKAGLWLAPFVCEKGSEVFSRHHDWLLKDRRGRPVPAGFNPNWSGTFYALDFYNDDFRRYLETVFRTVLLDWGFDMVKLDFLYAAALSPGETRTRGQVMTEAMDFLRALAGDKMVLGCGVPLGPAFGRVDACRIGSDVALRWEDPLLKAVGYRERVSTANSLASTVGRWQLHGRAFLNDPDVFVLRSKDQSMSLTQRLTLFRLNWVLGGMVLTSDDPVEYSEEEMRTYLSASSLRDKSVRFAEVSDGVVSVGFEASGTFHLLLANITGRVRDAVLNRARIPTLREALKVRLEPYESRLLGEEDVP